jgi:hypothetical protein
VRHRCRRGEDSTPLWFSRAAPGRTHDLTAARAHGIVQARLARQILALADRAYQGAGTTVRTPYYYHHNDQLPRDSSTTATAPVASSRRTRFRPVEVLGILRRARCYGVTLRLLR